MDFEFEGMISRTVLENYLSRSITMAEMLEGREYLEDQLRMIANIGAKFIGRAIYTWGKEHTLAYKFRRSAEIAERIHQIDPQIILQAGIFEIVTEEVNQIPIPAWVFGEFDLRPEERNFRYEAMLFPNDLYREHWGKGASIPDISQMETKLWLLYLAGNYLKAGMEALHFGQITLIGRNDPDLKHWWETLGVIRRFARRYARRHFVLCDAHVSSGIGCYGLADDPSQCAGGYRIGENLLLDFHALPLRIKEIAGKPQEAELAVGHLDALYGRSLGGIAPSGWRCEHLPYLVEFDNYGSSGYPGQSVAGKLGEAAHGIDDRYWIWGYDEICWFAHQSEEYRNQWLWYGWNWLKEHDPNGFLEMRGMGGLAEPVDGIKVYYANTQSPACPEGMNQEETIKAIWLSDNKERK